MTSHMRGFFTTDKLYQQTDHADRLIRPHRQSLGTTPVTNNRTSIGILIYMCT